MTDWHKLAADYWSEQPHPLEPSLKIKDFATAVRLATKTRFGGHASPQEAGLFWKEFQGLGMAPSQYEQLLERLAPVSFTYHGRPPSMHEIGQLKDKQPHEVSKYYGDLPDRHYPDLPAAAMVKALAAAEPHARQHLGRPAVKFEARLLHHSGERPDAYYQRLREDAELKGNVSGPNVQDKLPTTDGVQA